MNQSPQNITQTNVFLDTTILLEVILHRQNEDKAREALKQHAGDIHISTLTAHLIVHFGKKIVSLATLKNFLSDYTLLSLEKIDFTWAFSNVRGDDFEDALQLAVAIRHGCENFLTFDSGLYEHYKNLPNIKITLL